jgi:hypothetical protein
MQVFATIVAGVAVYVIGQIIQQFFLEAIRSFNKERGDISYLLLRYQAIVTNASAKDESVQSEIKELAASLISTMEQIPLYDSVSAIRAFRLPPRKDVYDAARELNEIAYNVGPNRSETIKGPAKANVAALTKIGNLLRIKTSYNGN